MSPSALPVVLINPSIEAVFLHRDPSGAWLPATIATYREAHSMQTGGDQILMTPGYHGVGISFSVSGNIVSLRMGVEGWDIEPGAVVVDAIGQSNGLVLAISCKYLGQQLSLDGLKSILGDKENTALSWIPTSPVPPRGTPAAEYVLYTNEYYSFAGVVIGRTPRKLTSRQDVRDWLVQCICAANDVPADSFIDMPGSYERDDATWVINALNMKLFAALPSDNGWRAASSYSRHGGPIPDVELVDWANTVMTVKSPHRVPVSWQAGPKVGFGKFWLAQELPIEP